ncbi:hypothetical protein OAV62_01325 [bacterium]|nr:hypothetical protein [bacterium]
MSDKYIVSPKLPDIGALRLSTSRSPSSDGIRRLMYQGSVSPVYGSYSMKDAYSFEDYPDEKELSHYEHYFRVDFTPTAVPFYIDEPFTERSIVHVGDFGTSGIWIMDTFGAFYMKPKVRNTNIYNDKIKRLFDNYHHHSDFLQGADITCGGEFNLDPDTFRLIKLNNRSGHYEPPWKCLITAKKELKSRKVNVSKIKFKKYKPKPVMPIFSWKR